MLNFHSCSTAAISTMQGRAQHGFVFPHHIIHASKYKSFSLAVGRYHGGLVRAVTAALFAPTPHGIPNLSPRSLVLLDLNPTKHGKCSCSQIPIEFSKKFSYKPSRAQQRCIVWPEMAKSFWKETTVALPLPHHQLLWFADRENGVKYRYNHVPSSHPFTSVDGQGPRHGRSPPCLQTRNMTHQEYRHA